MSSLLAFPKTVLDVSFKTARLSIGVGLDTVDHLRSRFETPPQPEQGSAPEAAPEDTGPDLDQARADAKREASRLERQAREGS